MSIVGGLSLKDKTVAQRTVKIKGTYVAGRLPIKQIQVAFSQNFSDPLGAEKGVLHVDTPAKKEHTDQAGIIILQIMGVEPV